MQKLTKIIATIGPASDSLECIEELIHNGVNLFRFNFKHSDVPWHDERMQRVKAVSEKLQLPIGILLDLQGPEVRLRMSVDQLSLTTDEEIVLSENDLPATTKGFTLSNPEIISTLSNGQEILADDGLFTFILKKGNGKTLLISQSEGILKNRKTINMPLLDFTFPVLHERDMLGLELIKKHDVDYIALSFVREASDIVALQDEMKKRNIDAQIMAKIETRKALTNIDDIIDASDSIMIARGDLGVEIPSQEVPYYQKMIIKKCIEKGKPVDTATQMLESMTDRPKPTRAEVSDVANAIYDFTDCIMLSGESASGKYPLEAVKIMDQTARFIEQHHTISETRALFTYHNTTHEQMMCDAAFNLYRTLRKKGDKFGGFLVFTHHGTTARMLSRYRPKAPIFAFSPLEKTLRVLTASFGVYPVLQEKLDEKDELVQEDIDNAIRTLQNKKLSQKDDIFIVLHGNYWASPKGSSTIRLVTGL